VDTYIIRIYRREESDPHMVVGTVEEPGIPGRKAFVNLDQLWDILNLKKKKLSKLKKKSRFTAKGEAMKESMGATLRSYSESSRVSHKNKFHYNRKGGDVL